MLESKNILKSRKDYVIGRYARHYNLNLPALQGEIRQDGRQVRNFETALTRAFNRKALYQLIRKDTTAVKRIQNKATEQTIILNPELLAVC